MLLGGMSGIQVFAHPEASTRTRCGRTDTLNPILRFDFDNVDHACTVAMELFDTLIFTLMRFDLLQKFWIVIS